MGRRTDINWQDVEVDFRLGVLSIRQVARKHDIADSNLRARARREGWTRDDGEAARIATREAVAVATRAEAREIGAAIGAAQAQQMREEMEEIVLSAVEVNLKHKVAVRQALDLAVVLLQEISISSRLTDITQEELERCRIEDPARAALIDRQLGIKGRVETLDKWSNAFARLTTTEREAFDCEEAKKENSVEELLRRIGRNEEGRLAAERAAALPGTVPH